jgi:hypothetical protein
MWRYKYYLSLLISLLVIVVLPDQHAAAGDDFEPVYLPLLQVSRTAGDIRIDGKLGDTGWREAAKAANFAEHRPGDQTKPPVETYSLITYDDRNLYVAFMCYDDPKAVRASIADRERVHGDDNICLCLDTYGDAAWAYTLNVNPYGVQADALWNPNTGEDSGIDLIWESAAQITDSGYQVEMAIPFSSLRFPSSEEQVWRVDFWRNHPRETNRAYSWAAYDRNESCWPCQWGTVTGISGVEPGKGIEIMPTWIGFQSGADTSQSRPGTNYDFVNEDLKGELSFFGKYAFSSDITGEVAYNPDFSQVEADAGQIDVNTTFALFYPERRPFFQEGSDIFSTLFNSFYTRTVNDPEYAGKFTARTNKTDLGYLIARDENSPITLPFEEFSAYLLAGKSVTNVLRGRHTIGDASHVGMIVTDRRLDNGGSGTIISHDARYRITRSLSLAYQAILSHTGEPDDTMMTRGLNNYVFWDDHTAGFDGESYWGHGGIAQLSYSTQSWGWLANYWEVSPTYRADNGYDPKNNRRDAMLHTYYTVRPENSVFEFINPWIQGGSVWNYDGKRKEQYVVTGVGTRLKVLQSYFETQYSRRNENFAGIQFDNNWNVSQYGQVRFGDPFAFGGSIGYGHRLARRHRVMAKQWSAELWMDVKPHDRVLMEQWLNYARGHDLNTDDELFDGYIYRNRLSYQVIRPLALRLVVEYDHIYETWAVDPLLTYRINPFSIFYIGTTYRYEPCQEINAIGDITSSRKLASRQFFMKLQYLFQI